MGLILRFKHEWNMVNVHDMKRKVKFTVLLIGYLPGCSKSA